MHQARVPFLTNTEREQQNAQFQIARIILPKAVIQIAAQTIQTNALNAIAI